MPPLRLLAPAGPASRAPRRRGPARRPRWRRGRGTAARDHPSRVGRRRGDRSFGRRRRRSGQLLGSRRRAKRSRSDSGRQDHRNRSGGGGRRPPVTSAHERDRRSRIGDRQVGRPRTTTSSSSVPYDGLARRRVPRHDRRPRTAPWRVRSPATGAPAATAGHAVLDRAAALLAEPSDQESASAASLRRVGLTKPIRPRGWAASAPSASPRPARSLRAGGRLDANSAGVGKLGIVRQVPVGVVNDPSRSVPLNLMALTPLAIAAGCRSCSSGVGHPLHRSRPRQALLVEVRPRANWINVVTYSGASPTHLNRPLTTWP